MSRNIHWEAKLRREHRLIALYALIQCWVKDADGLVLTHSDLIKILNIKRLEWSHIRQFAKNVNDFFPFVVPVWFDPNKQVVACFISRRPMKGISQNQRLNITQQISALKKQGVNIASFTVWKLEDSKPPLAVLKTQLVSLVQGGPCGAFVKYVGAR